MHTAELKYQGHFGGPSTPKSLMVDLCVQPGDRRNPFAIGTMRVATYAGRVTKASLEHVRRVMYQLKAETALAWDRGQWVALPVYEDLD